MEIDRRENGMRYKIVLHKSEEGYAVSCPGLPGCWSQGATESEALENIRCAIQEYLATVDDLYRPAEPAPGMATLPAQRRLASPSGLDYGSP